MNLIEAKGIYKSFKSGQETIEVLKSINLEIKKSQMVALMGVSGSGKSTLLHILGLLSAPDSGEVIFSGSKIDFTSEENLALFRNKHIGFVFQFYSLLGELTILENIMLPSLIAKKSDKTKALELLNLVGFPQNRANNYPSMLSGGQLQRIALARALINSPDIVIADEPTANLDKNSSIDIVKAMRSINKENGQTFLIATHSSEVADYCDKVLVISGGQVSEKN
ncbi:ABC transporter ATP-binding protein [Hippea jasoniae]|uniref:ABC transporter ATP-binding protein n=1 Tax=Hippea jasoniae TaxID=944479 RepID=UPI00054E1C79|nr:ABC transporter ATP-binding protein [Hippea jasoniae]